MIPYIVTHEQLRIAEAFWNLPPGGGYKLSGPEVQEALDWWNADHCWPREEPLHVAGGAA